MSKNHELDFGDDLKFTFYPCFTGYYDRQNYSKSITDFNRTMILKLFFLNFSGAQPPNPPGPRRGLHPRTLTRFGSPGSGGAVKLRELSCQATERINCFVR